MKQSTLIDAPDWLEKSIIMRGLVGSTACGTELPGTNDIDEMAVCIEGVEQALVLGQGFEQYIYRSAEIREGHRDAPSQAGDLDLTVFGLQKFCRLAADGNPTVLLMFFLPSYTRIDALGGNLKDMAGLFISKEAGKRFLGYMQGQRQRLLGERGQKRVKRPELEQAHGFDTKYAMHILRLGMQGVELLETGKLSLPMSGEARDYLRGVRQGAATIDEVLSRAGELERQLKDLLSSSFLPEHADRPTIEAWMQDVYLQTWKARGQRWRMEGLGFKQYRLERCMSCGGMIGTCTCLIRALGGSKE